jgi:hypothetical protein
LLFILSRKSSKEFCLNNGSKVLFKFIDKISNENEKLFCGSISILLNVSTTDYGKQELSVKQTFQKLIGFF